MNISKFVLVILVFFSIFFLKNAILTHYWSILAQLSFLPFLVWVIGTADERWYLVFVACLLVAFLLDIFSFSIFGFHLLLSIGLFLLAQAWISFFSITTESLLGFCITAPIIELFFIFFIQFFAKSIQQSWVSRIELFFLSFLLNLFFLSAWFYVFPPERLNNVE